MKIYFEFFLIILAVIILIYIIFSFISTILSPAPVKNFEGYVCKEKECFIVEIAKSQKEREKGLMNRTQLAENRGMLFVFEKEGIYPFWMKNTLIHLDIIWISSSKEGEGEVVFIKKNATPCKGFFCPSIIPEKKAKYVLEVNAGIADKIDLKIGDKLILP